MNKLKKNKGITLVSLIITIIIMLILATVSINAVVGNYGVIEQTADAKIETEIANEREAVQVAVVEDELTEEATVGTALYDRTVENGNKWSIVYVAETGTIYGTGWEYIESGTEVSGYGETTYIWLANYKTGEIIRLEEGEYTALDYTDSVAVTDNLILNIDSSVIADADESTIEDALGEGVELHNFDWTDDSGLTQTSFNFDGVDDYITIDYNETEEKETLAENGFTFEFYGIWNGGTSYSEKDGSVISNYYKGIFCYWCGDESIQAGFRFGVDSYNGSFRWSAGNGGTSSYFSDFSLSASPWNQQYSVGVTAGEEAYYTVTVDCSTIYYDDEYEDGYYIQTVYKDGELILQGRYNAATWDYFLNNFIDDLTTFCVGRCSMDTDGRWHYSQMTAYVFRLYSKGLTEDEVMDNYETSVAYHALIEAMAE